MWVENIIFYYFMLYNWNIFGCYCTFIPPSPPPIVIDDSSWKNTAESLTVALTLSLGGYESAIAPIFDLEIHFPSSEHMEELIKECGSSEESSSAQNVYDTGDIIVEKS